MSLIGNWQELGIIGLALALGGLMKGVTGVGLPLVAVPVMAGFLGVERAVLIMVIPSVVLNALQVWLHRDARRAVPEMSRVVVGGAVGVLIGASILASASDTGLAIGLAVWIIGYVLFRTIHPEFVLALKTRLRWSALIGVSAGAMQGATGISAPIVVPYADSLRLSPNGYVFAVCAPFGAFAAAHCALLMIGRQYDVELLTQSVLAVIPAVAFVPVGTWMRGFIVPEAFEVLVRMMLVVIAARLILSAF